MLLWKHRSPLCLSLAYLFEDPFLSFLLQATFQSLPCKKKKKKRQNRVASFQSLCFLWLICLFWSVLDFSTYHTHSLIHTLVNSAGDYSAATTCQILFKALSNDPSPCSQGTYHSRDTRGEKCPWMKLNSVRSIGTQGMSNLLFTWDGPGWPL